MRYHMCFNIQIQFAEIWFPSLLLHSVGLFAVAIDHFSAIAFQEFIFSSQKVGFEMELIILLKRSYLRVYCVKCFPPLTPSLLNPLFPWEMGQGKSEWGRNRARQKQSRKQSIVITSITHSIFWNIVRCPIPLFSQW